MPKSHKECIAGWKRLMPDFEFMRWDEHNFDANLCHYTRQAYDQKRWAFVSDVARLKALSEYGGVYLDTDVELFQRLDKFLDCHFFSGIELYSDFETEHIAERMLDAEGLPLDATADIPHFEILTSSFGAVPSFSLVNDLLHYYCSINDTLQTLDDFRAVANYDRLLARYLVPYGFRYRNETQHLSDNIVIYQTGIFGHRFCPDTRHEVSYHHNATTWDLSKWSRRDRIKYFIDKLGLRAMWHPQNR